MNIRVYQIHQPPTVSHHWALSKTCRVHWELGEDSPPEISWCILSVRKQSIYRRCHSSQGKTKPMAASKSITPARARKPTLKWPAAVCWECMLAECTAVLEIKLICFCTALQRTTGSWSVRSKIRSKRKLWLLSPVKERRWPEHHLPESGSLPVSTGFCE